MSLGETAPGGWESAAATVTLLATCLPVRCTRTGNCTNSRRRSGSGRIERKRACCWRRAGARIRTAVPGARSVDAWTGRVPRLAPAAADGRRRGHRAGSVRDCYKDDDPSTTRLLLTARIRATPIPLPRKSSVRFRQQLLAGRDAVLVGRRREAQQKGPGRPQAAPARRGSVR